MNFFGFSDTIDKDTQFVIFGIPWDYLTSTDLPNSAIAPENIRNITNDIGYTTELGFHIPNFKAADVGDVSIDPENVEKNITAISTFVKKIYNQNETIIPIMIGGDHFCTYPTVSTVLDQIEEKDHVGVLIFDAHLDFYQEWDKGVYSHATTSHRIFDLEFISSRNLIIIGTRDIDIQELELATAEKITFLNAYHMMEGVDNYINKITDLLKKANLTKLYVSIDIDALDPSIAPGTGYAIPGGFTYREMWKILKELGSNFDILGFDFVEVAPNLDMENKMTSILTAKLIVEFMHFIIRKDLE
ncbi:MAG: arginase family protein [Promethearchaeota archaeon]|jgi:agmatinase